MIRNTAFAMFFVMNLEFVTHTSETIDAQSGTVHPEELISYWDTRADSYLDGVAGELDDDRRTAWERAIGAECREALEFVRDTGRIPRILDLGCGPGFFEVLFAPYACSIDAVDASPQMIDRAVRNLKNRGIEHDTRFHVSDVTTLPFPDKTFDLAIARNVTWLLLNPEGAYAEWLRVLRPGGMLMIYDANWYRYLFDPAIDAQRRHDQAENYLEGWDEDAQADAAQELEFEKTSAKLPLSPILRPDWDVDTFKRLNASRVEADREAWRGIWTESERAYYGSSPMFMVKVTK